MTHQTHGNQNIVRPMADYSAATVHNDVVYTAGMTPRTNEGMAFSGIVGDDVTAEQAYAAARIAADRALDAIVQCVPGAQPKPLQMTVFIAAAPGFDGLSAVGDGASAAVSERTGSAPARAALGVAQLPGRAPVEVTLIAALTGGPDEFTAAQE